MKRRRHRAKSEILIDLTSLLDVIFIVLLVVSIRQYTLSMQQADAAASANDAAARATSMEEEAQALHDLYAAQLETADRLNEYVSIISVYAGYHAEDPTQRTIRVLSEGEEIETFELKGADVSGPMERFRSFLSEKVQSHQDNPVILSLNEGDEKILYRDERDILKIFDELRQNNGNVYLR